MKNLFFALFALLAFQFNGNAQCDANFTYTHIDCDSIWFVPVSQGAQFTYHWDFGDGQSSTLESPAHVFASDGTYLVVLTLSDTIAGCTNLLTVAVDVNCGSPCSILGAMAYSVDTTNCNVQFYSTASGGTGTYTYYWDFGDGTTSNQAFPNHQFGNNWWYYTCLTVTDANGCDTTVCDSVIVACNPQSCDASFNTTPISCDSIWFQPNVTGSNYIYWWDFGDGQVSTMEDPVHIYGADGTYLVTAYVYDQITGCGDTVETPIVIDCGAPCNINGDFAYYNDTTDCSVQFTSTAWGGSGPYTYYWQFGDGTSSSQAHPNHTYPNNTSWTVSLTVSDINGCDTTIYHVVNVDCYTQSCDASFTYTFTDCNTIYFDAAASGPQFSYYWDFGDGGTSNAENPTYSYASNGNYLAVLYIIDSLGMCSDALTVPININCASACTINGAFVPTVNSTNCEVFFNATAWGGNGTYTYFWNFGDGTTSTLQSPTHQYPNGSTWTPCLTITDGNGCDTTICDTVSVTCSPSSCDAQFTYTHIGCDSVWFWPASQGPQYDYYWDFGDGSYSTEATPAHQYASDGQYVVTFYLTDSIAGCWDAYNWIVNIDCGYTPCTTNGNFSWYEDSTSCDIQFISTAFGGQAPYSFYWNFGDGTTSNLAHPVHSYPNNTTWTPCLTITDANGCDTTICQVVTGNCTTNSCDATFTYSYSTCDSIWFIPASTGAQYDYYWDFGDGATSTNMYPSHQYNGDGQYTVVLYLTDSLGMCTSAYTSIVTVNCGSGCTVDGAFTSYVDSTNCNVYFYTSAWGGQAPYSYYWYFGDGTTSTGANPMHQYPSSGTYTVSLNITDVNGCDTTVYGTVYVDCDPSPCSAEFNYTYVACDSVWFIPDLYGAQYDYYWDFGDGATSTQASPAHQYAGNGTYLVVLYITDSTSGCYNAYTNAVQVNCGASPCDVNAAMTWYADSSCVTQFISSAWGGSAPYSYFWNFGDGTTSSIADPTHVFAPGTYTVFLTVTDANGCDTTVYGVLSSSCTNGLEENYNQVSFLAYPNPSEGYYTISGKDLEQIQVYDLEGRLVYQESLMSNETVVDIREFADGVYVLLVTTSDGVGSTKLIKQ